MDYSNSASLFFQVPYVLPRSVRYLRWTSHSSSALSVCSGLGRTSSFHVTVSSQIRSLLNAFTYQTPFVSSGAATNLPMTSSASVTTSGSNFGVMSTTITPRVRTSFQAAFWISDSSVLCKSAAGHLLSSFAAVTAGILSSSTSVIFTYNAPSISSSIRANVANSASYSVTLIGNSFGVFGASASARIAGTSCEAFVWNSGSNLRLKVSRGQLSSLTSVVSLQQFSSQTLLFSYDRSVVSSVNLVFLPSSGSIGMTVFGRNYGSSSYSVVGRLNVDYNGSLVQVGVEPHMSSFLSTAWISDSSVRSLVPIGIGKNFGVVLSVGISAGSVTNVVSFVNPVVRSVLNNRSTLPSTATSTVSITGQHFGVSGHSVAIRLSQSACKTSIWSSHSSVTCKAPSGSGALKSAVTTSGLQHGQFSRAISYMGASVSSILSHSLASTGGLSLLVTGRNVGLSSYSPGIRIHASASLATLWISGSTSVAKVSEGGEIALSVSVTMSRWNVEQILSLSMSYTAPAASSIRQTNYPSSGAASVTIFGSGLGVSGRSATARAGATICTQNVWGSSSSIACKVASGIIPFVAVQLSAGFTTMNQVLLQLSNAATYDAVSNARVNITNSPSSGSVSITLLGASIGSSSYSPRATTRTGCLSSRWVSYSSTNCRTSSGIGGSQNVILSVAVRASVLSGQFSFNNPVVTSGTPTNVPNSGSVSVTVVGFSFGNTRTSVVVSVRASACSASAWRSHSSVMSKINYAGSLTHFDSTVIVSLASQYGSITSYVSYNHPIVSSLSRNNGPRLGNIFVSVFASSFGVSDLCPSSRLGASSCSSSVWMPSSSVTCKLQRVICNHWPLSVLSISELRRCRKDFLMMSPSYLRSKQSMEMLQQPDR